MDKSDLKKSILEGALNPDTKDLVIELSEIGLDTLLSEGVAKEIPILRSIVACKKTWDSIHDQLFLRKVAMFFAACPKFRIAERDRFIADHLSDPERARRLGDTLVLILDKLDDVEKPQLLAKCFAAFVRGKIPHDTFRRLAAAIDIGFLDDLKALANDRRQAQGVTEAYAPNLLRTGLSHIIEHEDMDGYLEKTYRTRVAVSPLGQIFIDCMNAGEI